MPDSQGRPKPTIDERLEALAQTVEILAAMHRETFAETKRENEKAFAEMRESVIRMANSVDTLAAIVASHDEYFPGIHRRPRLLEDWRRRVERKERGHEQQSGDQPH